ncbi:hypothetical protein SPSIL_045150 [Sporomusa silvacetica DSM 10669]|uniref:Uncharacterized protein n=1 Tax=Sporomusa silvacetica DSM 10669 TaxID=1123289 RepID=A0ABZ3IRT5_9FIRM|nr:betaine reductase complex component B subunit alpha [Sporomusa silvacetica DSM 10669]
MNFMGVIMSNLNVALEQKEWAALFVTQMAKNLGADSALVVRRVTATRTPILPPALSHWRTPASKL